MQTCLHIPRDGGFLAGFRHRSTLVLLPRRVKTHGFQNPMQYPMKPPSEDCADKAQANYRHTCSHPSPRLSTIHNPYKDESSMVPHTHFGGCVAILGELLDHRGYANTKRAAPAALLALLVLFFSLTYPLSSFSLHETPSDECSNEAHGKIWDCMQPPKTPIHDY
jgi:hypothetical protein